MCRHWVMFSILYTLWRLYIYIGRQCDNKGRLMMGTDWNREESRMMYFGLVIVYMLSAHRMWMKHRVDGVLPVQIKHNEYIYRIYSSAICLYSERRVWQRWTQNIALVESSDKFRGALSASGLTLMTVIAPPLDAAQQLYGFLYIYIVYMRICTCMYVCVLNAGQFV